MGSEMCIRDRRGECAPARRTILPDIFWKVYAVAGEILVSNTAGDVHTSLMIVFFLFKDCMVRTETKVANAAL